MFFSYTGKSVRKRCRCCARLSWLAIETNIKKLIIEIGFSNTCCDFYDYISKFHQTILDNDFEIRQLSNNASYRRSPGKDLSIMKANIFIISHHGGHDSVENWIHPPVDSRTTHRVWECRGCQKRGGAGSVATWFQARGLTNILHTRAAFLCRVTPRGVEKIYMNTHTHKQVWFGFCRGVNNFPRIFPRKNVQLDDDAASWNLCDLDGGMMFVHGMCK